MKSNTLMVDTSFQILKSFFACIFYTKPPTNSRRRPPGWTPLRNNVVDPRNPGVKESSEEEVDPLKPAGTVATNQEMTAAPTSTPDPSRTQSPLNCPSKPWKQYVPWTPTTAPPAHTTAKPQVEGAFSDLDLLG